MSDAANKARKFLKRHGLLMGAGLVAAPMVASAARGAKLKYDAYTTKKVLKRENPDGLAADPNFERHFSTIKRFAPHMAADPVAATAALRSMRGKPSVAAIAAIHDIGRNEKESRREGRDIIGASGERFLGGLG